jgi:hypothetical protein
MSHRLMPRTNPVCVARLITCNEQSPVRESIFTLFLLNASLCLNVRDALMTFSGSRHHPSRAFRQLSTRFGQTASDGAFFSPGADWFCIRGRRLEPMSGILSVIPAQADTAGGAPSV